MGAGGSIWHFVGLRNALRAGDVGRLRAGKSKGARGRRQLRGLGRPRVLRLFLVAVRHKEDPEFDLAARQRAASSRRAARRRRANALVGGVLLALIGASAS